MATASKSLALVLILWAGYLSGQAQLTDGAIISWNNDTLPVKIAYLDIVNLQRELHVESPKGKEVFLPGEIRGFILNKNENLRLIDFSIYHIGQYSNVDKQRGIPNGGATDRANKLKLFDSLSFQRGPLLFTSITIDNNFSFFAINASKASDAIQAYYYFYMFIPTQKLLSVGTALDLATRSSHDRGGYSKIIHCNIVTFKDGKYLPYPIGATAPKLRKWLSGVVSDYPRLSKPVRNKEFPLSYFMVINAYNNWRSPSPTNITLAADTSVVANILAGVSDAKKHYKPKKIFWPTFAGSSLMMFPGMIYGASKLTKLQNHANQIEVPNINPAYADDKNYKLAYRSTAIIKSGKSAMRGFLLGFCVSVGAALTLALTE